MDKKMKKTVHKTIKVKIFNPTQVKRQFLELIRENSIILNQYISRIEELGTTSKSKIHKETYHELRKSSPLPAAILQTSRDKAVEAYKSYRSKKRNRRKTSIPKFKNITPVRLDKRTIKIIETDNKLKYFASIHTQDGRICVPLLGRKYQYKYIKKALAGELELGSTELHYIRDNFYLYFTVKKEIEIPTPNRSFTPVAVDIGLVNLAVSVTPSEVRFFNGRMTQHKRDRYAKVRRSLGKRKKLRKIKEIQGKEQRYIRDINHKISSAILEQAKRLGNPVVVLENLKNIREKIGFSRKMNRRLHNWNFRQLQDFIHHKAEWEGIPVVYLDAKYTSRTCPRCGDARLSNRKRNKHIYKCHHCGYQLNDDLIGAINLSRNFRNSMPVVEGAAVDPALNRSKCTAIPHHCEVNQSVKDSGNSLTKGVVH